MATAPVIRARHAPTALTAAGRVCRAEMENVNKISVKVVSPARMTAPLVSNAATELALKNMKTATHANQTAVPVIRAGMGLVALMTPRIALRVQLIAPALVETGIVNPQMVKHAAHVIATAGSAPLAQTVIVTI